MNYSAIVTKSQIQNPKFSPQAIQKNASQLGVWEQIKKDDEGRRELRMLMALAFLPENEIWDGYKEYEKRLPEKYKGIFRPLLNYYEDYWLNNRGPKEFCVNDLKKTTDNYSESYNADLARNLRKHPKPSTLIQHIKQNLETGIRNRKSIKEGVQVGSVSRRTLVRATERQQLCEEFKAGTKSVSYFLSRISYIIHKRAPKFEIPSEDDVTDNDDIDETDHDLETTRMKQGYGFPKFVKIDEVLQKKDEFIQNDTLSVGIDLIVYDEYLLNSITIKPLKSLKRMFSDIIHDVFNTKKRCDAGKYHVQSLKEMCEYSLSKTLNFENAIRIMIFADRHHAKQLKGLAIEYVIANIEKFQNMEEFKALEQTKLSLFLVIVKKCLDIKTKWYVDIKLSFHDPLVSGSFISLEFHK
ncbi:hypothetical protein KQX54_001373 [Cotesia glomerata]|uniref:BACK domain-containing protein n=1 Tax=Cotesia glomerata TaxID=32391 RepID=A0AAV7ITP6_COTGL|nr:hypothetical protein KQX54_001373 [Cotesia glomerata]